jgi:hypothetical protein
MTVIKPQVKNRLVSRLRTARGLAPWLESGAAELAAVESGAGMDVSGSFLNL